MTNSKMNSYVRYQIILLEKTIYKICAYLYKKFYLQVSSLHSPVDRELNVSKSVLSIILKYMSKDLAMKFTNVRQGQ